jgi:predicted RNase H-like nuclease (RuvC/YqgF family)
MEDNVSSRCTSHRRLRFPATVAAVLGGVLVLAQAVPAVAADKSRKSEPKREKPAKEKSANNKSVRTQQRTADAFGEKTDAPKKSQDEQPADTIESLQAQLTDLDDRIRKEDQRHESAMRAAKARKAIDKEESTHRRNRAALDAEREVLLSKLDALKPKSPAKAPADDRSTPAAARTR